MNTELYLAFLMAAIGLTLMPGPDNLFVLSESILRGARRGIGLSAGLASGVLIHTSLAASGLALILKANEWAFDAMMTLGAVYLLYIAYGTYREKAQHLDLAREKAIGPAPGLGKSYRKGFLMNVLNPKVTVFFLALLPAFVDQEGAWSPMAQMFTMGLSFMLQAFLIFSGIALLAGRLALRLNSPAFQNFSRWFQITILLLLAFGLLGSAWF